MGTEAQHNKEEEEEEEGEEEEECYRGHKQTDESLFVITERGF